MAVKATKNEEQHATPDNAGSIYTLGVPAKPKAKPQMDLTVKGPDGKVLFAHAELADKKGESGDYTGQGVYPLEVLEDLGELRLAVGHSMTVNSGARCAARNKEVGGAGHSFHVWDTPRAGVPGAVALDVNQHGWDLEKCKRFAELAWQRGWSIGVAGTFMHIDRRHRYGFGQVWGYYPRNKPSQELRDYMAHLTGRPGGAW